MSRVARSALNFAAATLSSVVAMVVAFVMTPLVLRELGAERLGVFRSATEWAGYLGLLELGVGSALAPLIAQAAASGNRDRLAAVLAAGLRAYVRVAVWTLFAGFALWVALPELIHVPPELDGEFRAGFALTVGFAVFLPLGVYRPLAEASQKGYLVSLLLGLQATATAVGCAAAASAGWGLPGQFGVTAACGLIVPVGLLLLLRRVAPPASLLHAPVNLGDETKRLRGMNRTTLVIHLVGRICLFTDNIVIGLFLGPGAVAAFFLTTRLPQVASVQVQGLGNATWAGLAELHHSGEHELFRQRVLELTRLTAVLCGALVLPLAALTGEFVALWVGPQHYSGDLIAALAVVNGIFQPLYSLWGWVFTGTGRIGRLVPFMIGQGTLNLLVSLVATWLVGLPGPLIGTAIVHACYNSWQFNRLLREEFGIVARGMWRTVATALVPALMVLAGLWAIRLAWPGESWPRLAIEFGCASGCTLALSWWFVLGETERQMLRRLRERLVRKPAE